jgi:hypothetical protein
MRCITSPTGEAGLSCNTSGRMMAPQASAAFVAAMEKVQDFATNYPDARRITLVMNNLQAKVNWQFTTKDAHVKLKLLYQTTTSWRDTRSKAQGNCI